MRYFYKEIQQYKNCALKTRLKISWENLGFKERVGCFSFTQGKLQRVKRSFLGDLIKIYQS